jgi:hypothetical protein
MEDVLTSSILGFIKYLSDELASSLLSAFAGLSELSGTPEIELWPRFPTPAGFGGLTAPPDAGEDALPRGDTEPDAVITVDDWLVFVEAKYRSTLDRDYDQLGREYVIGYRQALADGRRFRLLVVTAQVCAPTPAGIDLVEGVKQVLRRNCSSLPVDVATLIDSVPSALHWTNWQAMYSLLSRLLERQSLPDNTLRLISDMCRLLELRGLRPYSIEPLERAMAAWESGAGPDPTSTLSASYYRSSISATLAAGLQSLHNQDLSLLDPLVWRFCSTVSVSGYNLAAQTAFDLSPLQSSQWHFTTKRRTNHEH